MNKARLFNLNFIHSRGFRFEHKSGIFGISGISAQGWHQGVFQQKVKLYLMGIELTTLTITSLEF